MEGYSLAEAAAHAGGTAVGPGAERPVSTWAYDSRLPFREREACFVALEGTSRSGADYLPAAHARGVRRFCVRHDAHPPAGLTDADAAACAWWLVDDPLAALQRLASVHRSRLRGPVIGVTGSNGKTIVKEWAYALAGGAGAGLSRSPESFNSQLGVALSLLATPLTAGAAIVEAGISTAGEMARLEPMIRPDLGVLTMLGSAHDAGFADRRQKAYEKLLLFSQARALLYPADDRDLADLVLAWRKTHPNGSALLPWVTAAVGHPDARAAEVLADESTTVVTFSSDRVALRLAAPLRSDSLGRDLQLPCPFGDAASRHNLVTALLLAAWLEAAPTSARGASSGATAVVGLSPKLLSARIDDLPAESLRLQVYPGRHATRVIDDSYSADREGLRAAAEFFVQQARPGAPRVWVVGPIVGAEETLTDDADFVAAQARSARVDRLVAVGGAPGWLPGATAEYATVGEAIADVAALSVPGATVLIKGPRALRLDRLARALREQSHELRLELSLPALGHNVATYRARLRPSTRLCVMVKAEAYGAGGPEVAAYLAARGVDYLAVANVDEAVALRAAGISLPVIVAHATAEELPSVRAHGLEPEVTQLSQLRRYAAGGAGAAVGIHLKIDTGMHRLGFDATGGRDSELPTLLDELASGAYRVVSVFSHLSASETPAGDTFTALQNTRLLAVAAEVESRLGYRPWVHLLNSVGAWRHPALQHDMVRLGLGIYGVGLREIAPRALEPAQRLVAQLVQVRQVAAGEVVGYGLGGRADHERRIGVVNVGYADGLRRCAGHGRYALVVDGARAPIVGSVCMDFTMVDLSDCGRARVGDDVEVFGAEQPIEVLAQACETIPYEILTGIGPRVRRVWYR